LDDTAPELKKFTDEYGESLTLHQIAGLKTHSPMVELEVALQLYDAEHLSRFKLTDNRGIVLTYRQVL